MKELFFTLLVLVCLAIVGYSQVRSSKPAGPSKDPISSCRKNSSLVDADRPMVFISFVRRETVQVGNKSGDSDRLFFKLTNNFCSPILLDMSGEVRGWGDAILYYVIEDGHSGQRVSGRLRCHVCSGNSLFPGRSIVFSIPFRDADRGAVMRIAYEFEFDRYGSYESSNSLHTVAYYFSGLSESVLPRLSFK